MRLNCTQLYVVRGGWGVGGAGVEGLGEGLGVKAVGAVSKDCGNQEIYTGSQTHILSYMCIH